MRRTLRSAPRQAPGLPAAALAGIDGAEAPSPQLATGPAPELPPLQLSPDAAERVRREIARAGGREVCFLALVTPERTLVDARPVARGNHEAVVAAARDAPRNTGVAAVMIHNHPTGLLEP